MNGYSKLQIIQNTETKDSDLVAKADCESKNMETPERNHEMKVPNTSRESPAAELEGVDEEGPQINGPPNLRRNSSVASAYALQTAVRRAFSMTRSASCDRYSRIHDPAVSIASPLDGDDQQVVFGRTRRSETKKSGRGKKLLIKLWKKKLFGL